MRQGNWCGVVSVSIWQFRTKRNFTIRSKGILKKKMKEVFDQRRKVRRREDFLRLLREGKRVHCEQYSVAVVENGLDFMRLGLSIRKSVGGAVHRNYEKRLCREFFRREIIARDKGYDVLLIIKHRSESFEKSYRRLEELFLRSLK
jgi:ribonuclease P protein component